MINENLIKYYEIELKKAGYHNYNKEEIEKELEKDVFYNPYNKYEKKKHLSTQNEMKLFWILYENIDENYMIFPEIGIRRLIDKADEKSGIHKYIDILIVKAKNFEPVLAIELNEQQHQQNLYQEMNDISKKRLMEHIGIPLKQITLDELNTCTKEEIIRKIKKYL